MNPLPVSDDISNLTSFYISIYLNYISITKIFKQ